MSGIVQIIDSLRDKAGRADRKSDPRSLLIALPVFVLVGSLFFYTVNWFSDARRDANGGEVRKAATVILNKFSNAGAKELTSILSTNSMAYQRALPSGDQAAFIDRPPPAGSHAIKKIVKKLPPPTDDPQIIAETPHRNFQEDQPGHSGLPLFENTAVSAPAEEPDPASPIDYVFRKRRL